MKEFWDNRYRNKEFAYGIEPNKFFEQALVEYDWKGDILLPAEGEGRNAVFAAKSGLNVTAFDTSKEGQKKAIKLAASNNVEINYLVGELNELKFEEDSFDVIALIYAHFPAELKSNYHFQLSKYLKNNGIIIFEAFSKNHLKFNQVNPEAGGPKNVDLLFSTEEINNDFSNFKIIKLQEEEITLNEGLYHKGRSSVIRFIGKKNA